MTLRGPALLALVALAACSSESSDDPSKKDLPPDGSRPIVEEAAPDAYSVSYRNKVRLPAAGTQLDAPAFASQLKTRDPIAPARCAGEESPAYADVASFLGGITWTHPVAIVKDSSLPPLYDSPDGPDPTPPMSAAGSEDRASAPNIERPDLVGVKNGIGVFLSSLHGLIAVDARGAAPVVSCSMKLPGRPMSFLFHGDELVVLVNNAAYRAGAALLRYSVAGGKFHFVDAVRLEDQTIADARLFDSTIVAYTSWSNQQRHLGQKVIVVQWDEALGVDWQDSLLDDPAKQDVLEGQDPNVKFNPGDVVSKTKSYAGFVSASDRYLVVPRSVSTQTFTSYETYNYQVCTDWNPHYEQVQSCSVNYEKRANPDYKAPDPVSGNYSCNGKKLEDCIQAAAPVVSQWVYVPVGQTCTPVWNGRCEKYEQKSVTYPRFDTKDETELSIYRFENGSFTRFDSTVAKLVEKSDAIAFETKPLVLDGTVQNRGQLQFQNGHLYYVGPNSLETFAVAGNSLSYVDELPTLLHGNTPAIAFSNDRAMLSAVTGGYPTVRSSVAMLDLTSPSKPARITTFDMPGATTQLFLANGGILGPGSVQIPAGAATRNLEKLTLFSNDNGQELDNLLLGTEYDAFDSSFFGGNDDQRIVLSLDKTRIFVPYSGRHHADATEPTAHRLGIARIENGKLLSDRSFDVTDDIIRTAPVDDQHSLVFGDSAAYAIDHTSGDWKLATLQELFVPFATYRLNDKDLYATISRVGTKCRITTHIGDGSVFAPDPIAALDIPCNEYENPVGFGHNLYFGQTKTGVAIGDDGKLSALVPSQVDTFINSQPRGYCWTDGASGNRQPVDYLDAVPAKVHCRAIDKEQ